MRPRAVGIAGACVLLSGLTTSLGADDLAARGCVLLAQNTGDHREAARVVQLANIIGAGRYGALDERLQELLADEKGGRRPRFGAAAVACDRDTKAPRVILTPADSDPSR